MAELFRPKMSAEAVNALSSLALAHIGDAVFELLVRSALCTGGEVGRNHALHRQTVARVCAPAQAKLADRLAPLLTEEEHGFYRRGRNAHVHSVPKNASHVEYAKATGLEALFGALYLRGEHERLATLYEAITEDNDAI